MPGTLFFIDFWKAYDKLEWEYVQKCLEYVGFGTDLKKWIKLFYSQISSFIKQWSCHVSNCFQLSRVVRQGCPCCYIFFLGAESMGIVGILNNNIKGI